MSGDKKSSELPSRLGVKRGGKLLSRTSKPGGSTISSPPKAALASSWSKDEVHRRRNHLNEILRRRSGESAGNASSLPQDTTPEPDHGGQHDGPVNIASEIAELEAALKNVEERQKELQDKLAKATSQHGAGSASLDYNQQEQHEISDQKILLEATPLDTAGKSKDHDANLLQKNHELQTKLAKLEDQFLLQEVRHREELAQIRSRDASDDIRTRLHATEKQSQERLQQLLSLKSSISTMTRSEAQATDTEIVESFLQLANRVREWVISNYRRSILQSTNLPPETTAVLRSVTSTWPSTESRDRLALYQAIISNTLASILQEPLSFGIPETGPLSYLQQFADQSHHVASPEFREWRRATVRVLESDEHQQALRQHREDALARTAQELEQTLFHLTSTSLTPSAHSTLVNILHITADLQRMLALQKARYRVMFPRDESGSNVKFDETTMESINDDEDSDNGGAGSERIFLFCVFPSLQKHRDEEGEQEACNVLMKARVCCRGGRVF